MPSIDARRMMADLRRLATFGEYRTGVHRPTYSPQDVAARHWLAKRMQDAGLVPVIDGIGNVIGRSPVGGPRLLIGSHSESQNHAGWLDGALGVIYGIEVARSIREDSDCAGLAVDVASFADEEGHYGAFIGSRSLCGLLDDAEIDRLTSRFDDTPLRTALDTAGFSGRRREQIAPDRYRGFLEAHIEQGDFLDSTGLRLGIVTSIVAIWQYRIHFEGEQNHAGTTRMATRKDAGLALVRLGAAIDRRFPEVAGERTVWTTGRITLEPGAPSIIPGRAEMLFQYRDADSDRLGLLERTLEQLVEAADAAGPCRCRLEVVSRSEPKVMDPHFQDALEAAAERHAPGTHVRMPSGAGHDAQILAQCVPAGMLFVPSIGGISHHWREDTKEADIVLGCQVMATAAAAILRS
jgi:beta-ureidopropionase / N-carbamoyl-L-amino-acid hydrolase